MVISFQSTTTVFWGFFTAFDLFDCNNGFLKQTSLTEIFIRKGHNTGITWSISNKCVPFYRTTK